MTLNLTFTTFEVLRFQRCYDYQADNISLTTFGLKAKGYTASA
jgi:hypothetical protein